MNKIKQLSFVLFIFSALAFSYPVTQGFAQSGGQCDSNPACDPTSGTCCNQCDPNPACVASDPHAIPCCSQHISGGDVRDPRDHEDVRDPRDHGDTTFDDRPWREILKKCRQMKKSGRLSPEMRQECKAARKLKKESRR